MTRATACLFVSILAATLRLCCFIAPAKAAATSEDWIARVVSVEGTVQALRTGQESWVPVTMNDTYSAGDLIRVQERSRAAVVLRNDAILRLDQNTTVSFAPMEAEQTIWIKLVRGMAYFFSRKPRSLRVATPFVNGAGEGTEFLVRVGAEEAFISVFEGRVVAANEAGSLLLQSGESALAMTGRPPVAQVLVRPRDAVQWALHYPPVVDYRPEDFPGAVETDWQAIVRRSLESYWKGDLAQAFASLEGAPADISDPRFFTYRAALLLTVGRVDEADGDIERVLRLDPTSSHAFALQAVIAVAQNNKQQALDLATKAVNLGPRSSVARIALSYAQQARFDLTGALESLEEAVKLDPQNALAWSRLAEIWLSLGYLDRALEAARTAVSLNPHLARTQTVLGFAYLTQIETEEAKRAFEQAIALDQGAPLPRLGLGLAKIRDGDLHGGRAELEIAVSLDPNNALLRSYLGKAYFDEKRTGLDSTQFAIAKELDPQDPTPYFYDAILKQSTNRPVEALQDIEKSIALNDNRAVYRSRLLLDQDLAARSAGLGGIFRDLGFGQLALVEGWKSVNIDPANYSAHRLLADLYSTQPRHEIARVSELLQSQLLQPLNITPIQPQLAESNLFILEGAGPSQPSFNEFNPLFARNRLALEADGVVGNRGILGDDLVQSGVWGRVSYSLGQFHYESNGFRPNNDLNEDIYNAFVQASLSPKTSVQAEYRYTDKDQGDLELRFDPDQFHRNLRQPEKTESIRIGARHDFTPDSTILGSLIYQRGDFDATASESFVLDPTTSVEEGFKDKADVDSYMAEVQHLYRFERLHLASGIGYCSIGTEDRMSITFQPEIPSVFENASATSTTRTYHTNLYLYSLINYPQNVTWTIGGSADFFESDMIDRDQFNPKLGVTWNLLPSTTLRAAFFRVLKRSLVSNQTLEPTQVAGFNQFFDDGNATDIWNYGIGIDQKFSQALYGGAELSRRDLNVPYISGVETQAQKVDWEECLARVYLYWTPYTWLAASAEYQYEDFDRDADFVGPELFTEIKTHRIPLGLGFFHPAGFSARLKATFVDQKGEFGDPQFGGTEEGSDHFWVIDGSLSYRLPQRYGLISLEARNLFDEKFRFQDTDPANPRISPERVVLLKLTFAL